MGYNVLEEKIIKQMKQVKGRYLQRIREELIKVEKLYQSTLKQYYGKAYYISFTTIKNLSFTEFWKKKIHNKVTVLLEEVLTKLQEDLELYYKNLLIQLEARKVRPINMANITDSQNYLIIQITAVHAIDQFKRKMDTKTMKLIIEAKNQHCPGELSGLMDMLHKLHCPI
ncbi:LOW QUALITY PROTEIN: spermatogenesis-associated protein 1 [Molossus nigricans]